ncbi:hypothetical protein CT688_08870 [Dietzia sp. JS16-p6b]|nr:hypothetical protein CT688_08870 [Dietzia sp. JS16-p6b]
MIDDVSASVPPEEPAHDSRDLPGRSTHKNQDTERDEQDQQRDGDEDGQARLERAPDDPPQHAGSATDTVRVRG